MSAQDDDEKAYTTSEGMYGRAFRRGIRKGLRALTFGLLGGGGTVEGTLKESLTELARDARDEYETMKERSEEHGT